MYGDWNVHRTPWMLSFSAYHVKERPNIFKVQEHELGYKVFLTETATQYQDDSSQSPVRTKPSSRWSKALRQSSSHPEAESYQD